MGGNGFPGRNGAAALGGRQSIERLLTALSTLIDLAGMSRRQVESRLSAAGAGIDLTRLFGRKVELKFRHVLDICQVINLDPMECFRLVLPEPARQSPLLTKLATLFTPGGVPLPWREASSQPDARRDLQLALTALERAAEQLVAARAPEVPGHRRSDRAHVAAGRESLP